MIDVKMANKLKCWRKVVSDKNMNIWEKKSKGIKTSVVQGKFGKFYDVYADKESKNKRGRALQRNLVETKKESLSIANKYMKSHDKC